MVMLMASVGGGGEARGGGASRRFSARVIGSRVLSVGLVSTTSLSLHAPRPHLSFIALHNGSRNHELVVHLRSGCEITSDSVWRSTLTHTNKTFGCPTRRTVSPPSGGIHPSRFQSISFSFTVIRSLLKLRKKRASSHPSSELSLLLH